MDPETAFFAKHALFDAWERNKKFIPGKGLKNSSWHRLNGIDFNQEDFGLSLEDIKILASHAHSVKQFTEDFFTKVLQAKGKVRLV